MALPLVWLADVLRAAGLRVVETPGWKTRTASGTQPRPVGVLEHHTATPSSYQRPAPTVQLCIDGRSDLKGRCATSSSATTVCCHVIAAGRANHAGQAKASGPNPAGNGNSLYVGFEWDYRGVDQAPSPEQYAAAVIATRAVLRYLDCPAVAARGHKETSVTGKIDPGHVDLNVFRAAVASGNKELDMATLNDIFELVRKYSGGDAAFGYTIPRSPERVRTFAAAIPPRNGVVTGNDGTPYVSLVAGRSTRSTRARTGLPTVCPAASTACRAAAPSSPTTASPSPSRLPRRTSALSTAPTATCPCPSKSTPSGSE